MPVTPATFQANYPEFAQATQALIQNELNNAYLLTPVGLWAAMTDLGAQLRCAQALALSPFGRGMALANEEGKTVYDERLQALVRIVAAGGSVL